jgi:hypothetical protein
MYVVWASTWSMRPRVDEQAPQNRPGFGARGLSATDGVTPSGRADRMKSLSAAEARVIAALLAASPGDEATRARRSGVPRTTYQTIRRRALVEGWVQERYVPAPSAVGADRVVFRLAQPFAERRAEVVRRWREQPGVVVLWASPETVLSVSFEAREKPAPNVDASTSEAAVPAAWLRRTWRRSASPGPAEVPVYFDFEGAWSRRIGLPAPASYPQGLPQGPASGPNPPQARLRSLLSFPFQAMPSEGIALRFSAAHLSRHERQILSQGWAAHRVFPALAEIPSYDGRRDERAVVVTANLNADGSMSRLLGSLYQKRRIAPFLAVAAEGRALLAMLAPAPGPVTGAGPSVLELFEKELRDIEILREPLDTFFPVVDHRYDRLIPAPTA